MHRTGSRNRAPSVARAFARQAADIVVENPDKYGPWGGKSVGEPTLELTAPAIANAVAHALGRRLRRLPLDLETVFLGHPLTRGSAKRGSAEPCGS